MERKEIRERVEKILLKHEENTSEGSIYWDFEWVGGKQIPDGGGGYRQEGGEAVYADKAFYEEMTDFISQELDKAREEGRVEERDRIFWELDGINCVDEALPKNYSAAGMQFGINRVKEIVLQEELSKLKDNK